MPDCEEWVSEEVSDEEPHVYESETPETRAQFRHLYLLVEASARHPLRARGSDASVRQANKIQTDMQNMQIAAQLVKLGQYKRGGSSKKGKSKRGKGPCLRLSSRKGKAKGKSSKGKAEMQGGSSKNTLQQEAVTTLGNTKEDRLERAEKRQKARDEKAEREKTHRLLFLPANVPLGPWSWEQHYDEKPTKYNSWPSQQ